MNIAIIGTGVMDIGVGKGDSVRCNRTPENAAPLAQGATHEIILVWNEAVLQDPDGLLAHAAPGQVCIDMSMQLPQTAKGSLFMDALARMATGPRRTRAGCVAKLYGYHLVSAVLASLAESLAIAKKSGAGLRGAYQAVG